MNAGGCAFPAAARFLKKVRFSSEFGNVFFFPALYSPLICTTRGGRVNANRNMGWKLVATWFWLIAAMPGWAGEDSYHSWLRGQLTSEYGLTGGTWILPDNELDTLNFSFAPAGVEKVLIDVEAQPFSHALQVTTEDRPPNPWNYFVHFGSQAGISAGDSLLIVAWIQGVSGERGQGYVNHTFELGEAPYTSEYRQEHAPGQQWQQWLIPVEASAALPSSWYKVMLGYQIQSVQLAGVAIINYGTKYPVEELPQSQFQFDYEGRDPDALWRAAAADRIEQHRKAEAAFQITDELGNPLAAELVIEQQSHAFDFGVSIKIPERAAHQLQTSTEELAPYFQSVPDLTGDGRGFNLGVADDEMRWKTWEQPYWPGDNEAHVLSFLDWLQSNQMKIRGHMLVWGGFQWLPDDIEQNQDDPDYVRERIAQHISSFVGHPEIKGRVKDWVVLNEPAHLRDLETVFGGTQEYAEWFKQAAAADPAARLYINEYDILSQGGMNISIQEAYKEIIDDVITNGGPLDGIGLQSHVGYPLAPPALVYEIIEEFAQLAGGKSISITEYDAEGVDDFMAGEYMRDFLTVTFSHPSVSSFIFWGHWDPLHWLFDAPILREDYSSKPSGQTFIDMVFDQWWTSEVRSTNGRGAVNLRAFLGEYDVTVTTNKFTNVKRLRVCPGQNLFELTVDSQTGRLDPILLDTFEC